MNADGDAVGSLLSWYHLLQHRPQLLLPNGCPPNFGWMPAADKIVNGDADRARCEKALAEADTIVCVDFNTLSRIDFLAPALSASKGRKVLLDHHNDVQTDAFDIVVSLPHLSSACELVYWTMRLLWGEDAIDRDTARCLYTGICTDTGSFSYSSEQPSVYEAAAALVGHDIDAAGIHNHINDTFSESRLRFYGFVLSHRLRVFPESRFAYIYVTLEDQRRFGITPADMEGLVSYTMVMKQISVGALVREESARIRVSLRSKHDVDVNRIAHTYFNGGGHTKASGGHTTVSLQETLELLESVFIHC
ncbi:MAG: Exopolyphosphatase-related protein [bacterium P3]|nr:MAG: Exopolyphosphatase-related protein [bacterium P3]KWW40658.1 MAG: Exopolyphosphatase-related protein [bacterium F083]